MGYKEVDPSIGELKAEVIGARILRPGKYVGKVVDFDPSSDCLILMTDRGLHVEVISDDLYEEFKDLIRVGTKLNIEIGKIPGCALIKHAGDKYAVRDPDGKTGTGYISLQACLDYISENKLTPERVGIVNLSHLGADNVVP